MFSCSLIGVGALMGLTRAHEDWRRTSALYLRKSFTKIFSMFGVLVAPTEMMISETASHPFGPIQSLNIAKGTTDPRVEFYLPN